MERVMEMFKSIDMMNVYIIVGIVSVIVILFLFWVVFLRKKIGPPTEEIKNAEIALSEAKQKEAELYAEDEYKSAEDSLAKATHLLTAKEYGKAKKALEDAAEQARQASKAVEKNKARDEG